MSDANTPPCRPGDPPPADLRLLHMCCPDGNWRELECHECGGRAGWASTPTAYVCYSCGEGKVRGDGKGGWVKV